MLVQRGHQRVGLGGRLGPDGLLDEVEEALDALGIGPPGHGIDTRPPAHPWDHASVPPIDRLSALDCRVPRPRQRPGPAARRLDASVDGRAPSRVGAAPPRRRAPGARAALPPPRRAPASAPATHWVDDAGFDVARHVHGDDAGAARGAGRAARARRQAARPPARPRPPAVAHVPRRAGCAAAAGRSWARPTTRSSTASPRSRWRCCSSTPPATPRRRRAPARWSPAPRAVGAGRAWRPSRAASWRAPRAPRARPAGHRRPRRRRCPARCASSRRRRRHRARPLGDAPPRGGPSASRRCEGAREAGRRHGATINDVLLAASTLALGRALRRRGERPRAVKALVPVNVRGRRRGRRLGNRISFVTVALPVAVSRPDRPSCARVRDDTRARKAGGGAAPLEALAEVAELLPGRGAARRGAHRRARGLVQRRRLQRAGPAGRARRCSGRRVSAIFPAVPFLHGPRAVDRRAVLPRAAALRRLRRRRGGARRGRRRPRPRGGLRRAARRPARGPTRRGAPAPRARRQRAREAVDRAVERVDVDAPARRPRRTTRRRRSRGTDSVPVAARAPARSVADAQARPCRSRRRRSARTARARRGRARRSRR